MAEYAEQKGIPVILGSISMMERGRIAIDDTTIVAGAVPFVLHALRRLGISPPLHEPYPSLLSQWLNRRVTRYGKLRDALTEISESGRPLFIKPAKGWKRFTGFVVEFPDDPRFNGASRNAPVWASEPIDLISEWRAYVAAGSVLAVKFADNSGEQTARPDLDLIHEAIARLVNARAAPAGFVIDFGVDRDGRTILVEVNDGFSFGAYDGVDSTTYWTVAEARWRELVRPI